MREASIILRLADEQKAALGDLATATDSNVSALIGEQIAIYCGYAWRPEHRPATRPRAVTASQQVEVRLPEQLRTKFKVETARRGTSMQQAALALVTELLDAKAA